MADITKCAQSTCPNAGHCWRVQAPTGDWQSWAEFKYTAVEGGAICENYLSMRANSQES